MIISVKQPKHHKSFFLFMLFCSVVGIGLLLYAVFVEPYWLHIRKIEYDHPDVPSSFDGKKVIFLSDIHYGRWFSNARLKSLVKTINSLDPDIVLFGGDLVDQSDASIAPAYRELGDIIAPLGVYAVLGNHDYLAGDDQTLREMEKNYIAPLVNNAVSFSAGGEDITQSITVGGVDDLWKGRQDTAFLKNTKKDDFVMLLSHNPDSAEYLDIKNVDLMLSGHTHGGQVVLFGYAPLLPSEYAQKYRYGCVKKDTTDVCVTSGVGTLLPIRFGVFPEIVVYTLHKK